MAFVKANVMKLQIKHGSHIHDVLLSAEEGSVLTVQNLVDKIAEITQIPPANQKILFKGKTLNKSLDAYLTDTGLVNGSKVMLLGKKPDPVEDKEMTKMMSIEQVLKKEEDKQSELTYELDGIHRGFMEASLREPALQKIQKKIAAITEQYMKLLESLDSLHFEEHNFGGRGKRKTLVKKIQTLLDRCDGLSKGISDMLASDKDTGK